MSGSARAQVTLVLGGARSGKSAYAEELVSASGLERVYIATGRAFDTEMEQRIALHRQRRESLWTTVEEPFDLAGVIGREVSRSRCLLVDCLTLWVTNLMLEGKAVEKEVDRLAETLAQVTGPVVVVSNEVGLGIVPDNAMAREFRDLAGHANQRVARIAQRAIFVAAGLPLVLKGPKE
ncbi:MAG: bifunctional adenosylcobinamide kinase/adenosylcobinamide-phosphate guanylyltransferase [Rhizobiaceae bacterium]